MSQRRAGVSSFYQFDALGSTDRLLDASGATTDSYLYRAFGGTTTTGSTENPCRFVGGLGYSHETMATLGLWYVRERWLQSSGRWHSVDPVPTEPAYQYVRNMPTMAVDPSGRRLAREWLSWWCGGWPCVREEVHSEDGPAQTYALFPDLYFQGGVKERQDAIDAAMRPCFELRIKVQRPFEEQLKIWERDCTDRVLSNPWYYWGAIGFTALGLVATVAALPVVLPVVGGGTCAAAVAGGVSIGSGVLGGSITVGYARFCRSKISCCRRIRDCYEEQAKKALDAWLDACEAAANRRFATCDPECERWADREYYEWERVRSAARAYDECGGLCKP